MIQTSSVMKKLITILLGALCAFLHVNAQISITYKTTHIVSEGQSSVGGSDVSAGPLSVSLLDYKGSRYFVFGVSSTNETDERYNVIIGDNAASAIKTLEDLSELCSGQVGETFEIVSANVSLDDSIKQRFHVIHTLVVTDRSFSVLAETDEPGKAIVFLPEPNQHYLGIIGVQKKHLDKLLKSAKSEFKDRGIE